MFRGFRVSRFWDFRVLGFQEFEVSAFYVYNLGFRGFRVLGF